MKTVGRRRHAAPLQEHYNFKDPSKVIHRMNKKYINREQKIGKVTLDLNTPLAPSGLKRVKDAMRRDTAAPSFWGLAFSWSVSA